MRNLPLALSTLALSLLAGCSTGSESGVGGGQLFVRSCSLGCSDGSSGVPVTCQIQNTVQNTEISILFSEAVDINSVTSTSFRVSNVNNGTTPVGEYFLDPNNPRRVVFRPALTFDLQGNPSFGFDIDTPYQITIAGELHDATGPFIKSMVGRPNQSRLNCTIVTNDQITDPVPGPPVVRVYADYVEGYVNNVPIINKVANALGSFDGQGTDGLADNLVSRLALLTDVHRTGSIYMLFLDVMNPATLVDPVENTSPFITMRHDEDGDILTIADRSSPVIGTYVVSVDTELLQTLLVFTPDPSFLSAGPNAPANPRLTVVDIPPSCVDLSFNSVTPANGGGLLPFVTEEGSVTQIELPQAGGETFADTSLEDSSKSGGAWGTGRLNVDIGGGSGRLGELIVRPGSPVVLNTDSQIFPLGNVADLIGNADMFGEYPETITVTDGVFEFSTLIIQPGGVLRLEGSNPARILVRGPANVTAGGLIDLSGESPGSHSSDVILPEVELGMGSSGGAAGAGLGGWGADRWDFNPFGITPSPFIAIGGVDIPETTPEDNVGRDGEGIGGSLLGGGVGGPMAFTNFPDQNSLIIDPFSIGVLGAHGANPPFNRNDGGFECIVNQIGTAGSGGAYARDGGDGMAISPVPMATEPLGASNSQLPTLGGSSFPLGLAAPSEANAGYTRRTLDWAQGGAYPGFLRGGSGGGGGGLSPYDAKSGTTIQGCVPSDTLEYAQWFDHSGAKGGGGGGALHLVSGKSLLVNGVIDLSGGTGGGSLAIANPAQARAMPGGGGSGGAIRMQGKTVLFSPIMGRLDISGGVGGAGFGPMINGGDGSVGLVRVENSAGGITHQVIAPSITPFEGDGDPPFSAMDKSLDFLSVVQGGFVQDVNRPDSICASTSCWFGLPGTFAVASFLEDISSTEPGWNMDIIWDPGTGEVMVPFRTASTEFPMSFETMFGNHFGPVGADASPVVVRFQGARITQALSNPCNVTVTAQDSPFEAGSLSPWVAHPSELNEFSPNVFRFVVLFDNTENGSDNPGLTLDNVKGVTNLVINADAE